jgi:hypothetical protein
MTTNLKKENAELRAALKELIAASQHVSPFGGNASVKAVRLAARYMAAHDRAVALVERKPPK